MGCASGWLSHHHQRRWPVWRRTARLTQSIYRPTPGRRPQQADVGVPLSCAAMGWRPDPWSILLPRALQLNAFVVVLANRCDRPRSGALGVGDITREGDDYQMLPLRPRGHAERQAVSTRATGSLDGTTIRPVIWGVHVSRAISRDCCNNQATNGPPGTHRVAATAWTGTAFGLFLGSSQA